MRPGQRADSEFSREEESSSGSVGLGRPFIGSSAGTQNNAGVGCVGCHGREEDAGNDGGVSPGRGAGLRQHHTNAGVTACGLCHPDALPANHTPVDENVLPQYYGTADTLADAPCNTVATAGVNENWSVGDFIGSDNDGDLIYDAAELIACPEPGESLLLSSGVGLLMALRSRRGRQARASHRR